MSNHPGSGNVFRSQNFRLVFFGALVSELGAILYSFAVSFYLLDISGNNAFLQGLYLALCGGILLLSTPIGGVLGDRYNKAKIMFLCDYAKGGVIILATLLMLLFPAPEPQIVLLFTVGILGNMISGIFSPASGSLLPYLVAEDKLQQANAYFSLKSALQTVLGVVLAGVLYALLPVTTLFFIVGLCYVLSGVSEMFIRYAHVPSDQKMSVELALDDMRDGLNYLKGQKPILVIMGAALFINFFITPLSGNFLPYFVRTDIALAPAYLFDSFLTPELWSSVFSVLIGGSSLIGSILLSAGAQAEKIGRKTALRLCAMAGAMVVLSFSYWLLVARGSSLNVFLILFCLGCLWVGFLLVHINVPINTVLMRLVARDKLSKVTSIVSIMSQAVTPIASVLAGLVLQTFGSSVLLFICSAGFTATALVLLFHPQAKVI